MLVRILFILLLIGLGLVEKDSHALLQSVSSKGVKVNWDRSHNTLLLHVHPSNTESIDQESLEKVIDYSIGQWNGHSSLVLNYRMEDESANICSTENSDADCNDLYFSLSGDSERDFVFGRSVLAITQVSYGSVLGDILEADIVFNSSISFSGDLPISSGTYFLGDVLTHELGHLMGLGHGQVHGSSMIYSTHSGQHSVHSDEKVGLASIYSIAVQSQTTKGKLKGVVAGSNSTIGVWGAYVQAISSSTGMVVASVVTDKKGNFSLSSLPAEDTYYLYVSPLLKNTNLPSYYDSIEADFCPNDENWRGGYYQKCGQNEDGHPQGFYVPGGGTVEVGVITIRCGLKFLQPDRDGGSDYTLDLIKSNGSIGEAITTFFSNEDIIYNTLGILPSNSKRGHTYNVDLSSYNFDSSKNLFLDIKVVAQALYSPLRTNVIVRKSEIGEKMYPATWNTVGTIVEGEPNFDSNNPYRTYYLDHSGEKTIRHALDKVNQGDNIFSIQIVPQPLTQGLVPRPPVGAFLSGNERLASDVSHYLMILSISEQGSNGNYALVEEKDHRPFSDNLRCMDVVQVRSSDSDKGKGGIKNDLSNSPLCGAVSSGDSPPSGGGGLGLILLISFFWAWLQEKREKREKISV